jgi:hypothetical protein
MRRVLINRVVSAIAIIAVAYVIYWLAHEYTMVDAEFAGILSFVFGIVIYFMGRSDKYEETRHQSDDSPSHLSGSNDMPAQPPDNGSGGSSDSQEHSDTPEVP